jgi:predicted dehydrogenase
MSFENVNRRSFLSAAGAVIAGTVISQPLTLFGSPKTIASTKKRIAVVGTGVRALGMWTKSVAAAYPDHVEYVGLCDNNIGRADYVRKATGFQCPVFTDFDKMMTTVKPDTLIVTTVDSTHHDFIIRGMQYGAHIITEKPLTTDAAKCEAIIQAQKKTGKNITVTFNYRYSPHRAKIFELLHSGAIGKVTSVDFHWYLDTSHGADYFRRWHRLKEKGGTLWVHKATHHFDLLNWWLDSDPEEVFATGALEHYGKNNDFRHTNCRPCPHKEKCKFYFDMTKNPSMMALYADNEKHDGYLRDGCVWKEDIDIYDKMAATIRYANGVNVSYSLTTYSPYEGYRIAFNGTKGRIDCWIEESNPVDPAKNFDEIVVYPNFGSRDVIRVPQAEGHGGGDTLLKDKIFLGKKEDPLRQSASLRDGVLSVLVGIAARTSCETGKPVKIADLTSLKPGVTRIYAQ